MVFTNNNSNYLSVCHSIFCFLPFHHIYVNCLSINNQLHFLIDKFLKSEHSKTVCVWDRLQLYALVLWYVSIEYQELLLTCELKIYPTLTRSTLGDVSGTSVNLFRPSKVCKWNKSLR